MMMTLVQRYSSLILCLILAFAFLTRMYRLADPKIYIFDEVYHAVTAKLVLHNDPRAYEWWNPPPEPNTAVDWLHPPLAKYTQALGMFVFGENSYGWRISSAITGLMVIALVYSLSRELFKSEPMALLAAFLASLDGLLLTQSRIAMNDIHVTFFILLTLNWYLKYASTHRFTWLWLTGLGAGLALSSKWSGLFVIGIVGFFEVLKYAQAIMQKLDRHHWLELAKQTLIFGFVRLSILVVLPLIIYLLSYTQMFWQGKSLFCFEKEPIQGQCYFEVVTLKDGSEAEYYISHFHELHQQIWWYQTNLKATHAYQSRPWQWFLNLKPVWYHVNYVGHGQIANTYALGNTALFWLGGTAVIFTGIFLLRQGRRSFTQLMNKVKTKGSPPHFHFHPLLFLLVSYLAVWLPWQLSPRIMFFYHYTPAVPLMSITLAYWLVKLGHHSRWLATLTVALIVACFIIWYPQWTALPVPTEFAESVYYALKSWK